MSQTPPDQLVLVIDDSPIFRDLLSRAIECFERALEIAPDYPFARAAVAAIRKQLN